MRKPDAWRTKERQWDNGSLKRYYTCAESCDGKSPYRKGLGEPLYLRTDADRAVLLAAVESVKCPICTEAGCEKNILAAKLREMAS